MLIGHYEPSIDAKGRLNFPARFREELGERFILTRGYDGCLFVYSMQEWACFCSKIRQQPEGSARMLRRFFFSNAEEAEPDKQGRIVIPAHLREYAGLKKELVVTGDDNRAEIWDKERWQTLNAGMTAEAMEELLQTLPDF
jgi:MraZ protein